MLQRSRETASGKSRGRGRPAGGQISRIGNTLPWNLVHIWGDVTLAMQQHYDNELRELVSKHGFTMEEMNLFMPGAPAVFQKLGVPEWKLRAAAGLPIILGPGIPLCRAKQVTTKDADSQYSDATTPQKRKRTTSTPTIRRFSGQKHSQSVISDDDRDGRGHLWPQGVENLDGFEFAGRIRFQERSLVFDFGIWELHYHFGLHTSVLIMSKKDFIASYANAPMRLPDFKPKPSLPRKGKLAMALELEPLVRRDEDDGYVIAFVSKDFLSTPTWRMSQIDPHGRILQVDEDGVKDYLRLYQHVASWLRRKEKKLSKKKLAIMLLRSSSDPILPGIGAYSSSELFFLAGLSPDLSEEAVFMCPSRVGRLVESYCAFVGQCVGDEGIWAAIRPALHQKLFFLAPTKEQRIDIYRKWVNIHARNFARVTVRQHRYIKIRDLLIAASNSSQAGGTYSMRISPDFYDPIHSRRAFTDKQIHCASLIFGQGKIPPDIPPSAAQNPIECYFADYGMRLHTQMNPPAGPLDFMIVNRPPKPKPKSTTVKFKTYLPLFGAVFMLDTSSRSPDFCITKTYSIRMQTANTTIWSVVRGSLPHQLQTRSVKDKRKLLHEHIVKKTADVGVGPLEYYGNGVVVSRHHGNFYFPTLFSAFSYPPALQVLKQTFRTDARKSLGLTKKPGKPGLTHAETARVDERVGLMLTALAAAHELAPLIAATQPRDGEPAVISTIMDEINIPSPTADEMRTENGPVAMDKDANTLEFDCLVDMVACMQDEGQSGLPKTGSHLVVRRAGTSEFGGLIGGRKHPQPLVVAQISAFWLAQALLLTLQYSLVAMSRICACISA
ncbi:hypothetical protein BKA62DRAFT_770317 [Auriculariales sp. MPI-PUGE-AT-0066]|nr:hypothetical protein BKA62DRAFT_770317 [Auriculariales sp. MPI-PUGE-AT-0066]